MNKNSHMHKNEIKDKLISIKDDIDDMYYTLEKELREEIIQGKNKKEIETKEANEVFKKLNREICSKILKNKLPMRVKLFNKIECMGFGVTQYNNIEISFCLNENYSTRYQIELRLSEINKNL
jgi:Skp family chaperone for outer membrane proteins